MALAEYAKRDYWVFKRAVLQENWLDPYLHGDVIIDFCNHHNWTDIVLLLPRGCGKTGLLTQTLPAWLAAKDPNTSGLIVNAREDKASQFAKACAEVMVRGRYQEIFPYIQRSDRWSAKMGYYTIRSINRIDPTVGSYGVTGNITGAHVSYLILDDLINMEMARFANQVKQAEYFYQESLNCLDPGGMFIVCGTRWTSYDYYGKLISGELASRTGSPLNVLKLGAERKVKLPNGDWGIEIIFPERSFIDLGGVEKKVGYTKEFLVSKQKSDPFLYSALYMNEPVSENLRVFDLESLQTFPTINDVPCPIGKLGRVIVETASGGISFFESLRAILAAEGRKMPLMSVKPSPKISKRDKLRSSIGAALYNGDLAILDSIYNRPDSLGQELRDFDKGTDDCLDALHLCLAHGRNRDDYGELTIGVDPAYSIESTSDHTAIVAGCYFKGVFYVLECLKFKTQKAEVTAKKLIHLVVKMNKLMRHIPLAQQPLKVPVFRAGTSSFRRRERRMMPLDYFEIESRAEEPPSLLDNPSDDGDIE